eukprot:9856465-Prorocentrum_lima.AAC.1
MDIFHFSKAAWATPAEALRSRGPTPEAMKIVVNAEDVPDATAARSAACRSRERAQPYRQVPRASRDTEATAT